MATKLRASNHRSGYGAVVQRERLRVAAALTKATTIKG
jgi:hypothetical protein